MVSYPISNPFPIFASLSDELLNGGDVFIGDEGMDPETNPKQVYWDAAETIPASQPLETLGGYVWNSGAPAIPFTSGAYSIRVRNRLGVEVFYEASVNNQLEEFITDLAASSGVVASRTALSNVVAPAAGATYFLTESGREGDFIWRLGDYAARVTADSLQALYVASSTIATTIGAWVRDWDGIHGYPEWFGVVANDGSGSVPTTNLTAINAASILIPKLLFRPGDYYVSSTVKHFTPNHQLIGQSSLYDSVYGTGATRLLVTNGTSNVLQVGPDANPGSIAQFPEGIKVSGIQCARTVAPVIASACKAILVQFVLESYFEDVRGDESMTSWEFNGTVSTRVFNCSAKRTSAGTGAGSETWKGFYANGNSGIAAGGNASLYLAFCHADDTRSVKTDGNGFYADNDYTDLFLDHCETVSCTVGMNFQGNGTTGADVGNTDVHVIGAINDAFATYGIYINDLNEAGSIVLTSCYYGPASAATAALEVLSSTGAITETAGQFVMSSSTGCKAVVINGSTGVRLQGSIINECTATAVELTTATNCNIQPTIKNKGVTGGAGVQLNGACTANYVAPMIMGKVSGTNIGIQLLGTAITFTAVLTAATSGTLTANWANATGTYLAVFSDGSKRDATFTNGSASVTWTGAVTASASAHYIPSLRNEFNLSGIDSACINTGSANKLVAQAGSINTTGLSGTSLVSGVTT